ncbi:MAG: hypothetical protein ACE5HC_05190, partial [Candidatus Binatia bacterium]
MHLPASTALRSGKGLDVRYSTPARFVFRAPDIYGHLRALASRPGKKCGLGSEAQGREGWRQAQVVGKLTRRGREGSRRGTDLLT